MIFLLLELEIFIKLMSDESFQMAYFKKTQTKVKFQVKFLN